jgi:hypothetical protein
LFLIASLLAAASMWFYVDQVLVGHQVSEAAANQTPRGNLSDLYPRWLGARELLLHGRNPYSQDITLEIQKGYYGRALDASRPNDPKDQQGFAYPAYVVFLLAPLIGLPFHSVQIVFHWLLVTLSGASVLLWLRVLRWQLPALPIAAGIALFLGCVPAVQGIKLQQLTLLVAAFMAASAACVTSGFLFLGGAILALATIKPQLAWPLVLWLMAWAIADWRSRRGLVLGFAVTLGALFLGAELVLPGWWRMFLAGLRQYHQYTRNESVLDQLVNWMAGRFGGDILAGLAVAATGFLLWGTTTDKATSRAFGPRLALVLALTVLIVPMYAPYNQVLLLPAILFLWRYGGWGVSASGPSRLLFAATGFAVLWQWVASLAISVTWFWSREHAFLGWKMPFYATFALPVLVFCLTAIEIYHQQRALRFRELPE